MTNSQRKEAMKFYLKVNVDNETMQKLSDAIDGGFYQEFLRLKKEITGEENLTEYAIIEDDLLDYMNRDEALELMKKCYPIQGQYFSDDDFSMERLSDILRMLI